MRINALLRADSAVTPDAMRRYQTDPGSPRADLFIPAFLEAARRAGGISANAGKAASMLGEGDRLYTKSNKRAVLFEQCMTQLTRLLWDELRIDSTHWAPIPSDMMTAVLLRDSSNAWWDNRGTREIETRDEILVRALNDGYAATLKAYGDPGERWEWDHIRFANIFHLLGLPALSREKIPVQGGTSTLWPSSGNGRHGPSWRMVVELDSVPKAWAIYPGGQSGNPLSPYYDNRIAKWSAGELDTLMVPRTPDDISKSHRSSVLRFTATGARR
jgi:penicillin amidase